MRRTPEHSDRGSSLSLGVSVVIVVVALIVVCQACWLGCGRRARSMADLVAITAARAHLDGDDACDQAQLTAEANRVELARCTLDVGYGEFIVDVEVHAPLVPKPPLISYHVTASAKAGVISQEAR